jgi:hypothetical protein
MNITNIHTFVKASSHRPFQSFADKVSDARREGDASIKSVAEIMYEKLPDFAIEIKNALKQIIDSNELDIEHVKTLSNAIKEELVGHMSHDDLKKFKDLLKKLESLKDSDGSQTMIAEMMKLVDNAAFGRSGMDKSKHKEVKYANESNIDDYTFAGAM